MSQTTGLMPNIDEYHINMSDSASIEKKFKELLQQYHVSVLPYTIENYNNLDDQSKQSVGTFMNFFVKCIHWFIWLTFQPHLYSRQKKNFLSQHHQSVMHPS